MKKINYIYMENKTKNTETLNKLVEINNDRIEGYERAAKETEDMELKSLFLSFSSQSRGFRSELESLVREHGGSPVEGTTTSGKFYRAWMDIKAALTGKDKKAIISSCEFGEDVAKDTYKDALHDLSELPQNAIGVIQNQYAKIREAHDKIKTMRDVLLS
jgi:uncharacterized protein (TIGR02284 family)